MNFFRKISLKHRLIITFLIVSIVPLLYISIYSLRLNSTAVKKKISASTTQLLSLVNTNMITEIEKYQYLCGSICVNEDIQNALLVNNFTSGEKNKIILHIQNIVKTKIIYPAQAKNITILDKDGNIFYDLGYDGFYEDDLDLILSNVKSAANDSWTYVKTYRSRDILVLARKIYNSYNTSQLLGYSLISIDENIFSKTVLTPVNIQKGSNIIFMDSNGLVLSSWDRSIPLGEKYDAPELIRSINAVNKKEGSFTLDINGKKQLVNYFYNSNIDKFFISFIPYSYINSESNMAAKDLMVTTAVVLTICCTVIVFIYTSISVPIRKMVHTCQNISSGNLNERIQDNSHDELSYLSYNINSMVEKIQGLLTAQKEHEKKKRELELQMLQYQINPHFLFNTLNALKLVATMNQDMVVSDGIRSLSELLKNTLINKQEFISIGDELNNLKHYLSIMTIRYAGSFHVTYDIEEELLSYEVPKLILQPLAENAVLHGSRNDGSILKILVRCYSLNDTIILELSDDGKGFDTKESKTTKILNGIGTNNVNDRIHLNFGEDFGLSIISSLGEGTVCRIKIPKIKY